MSVETPDRFTLRRLPLPARLVLSAFLMSVGIGYVSALVQLHFQHAKPGKPLPGPNEAVARFHGVEGPRPVSQIERLLEAPEDRPFNGSGQMRNAFTKENANWESDVLNRAMELDIDEKKAEDEVRKERETERRAMVEWVRAGAPKDDWEKDRFVLPPDLAGQRLTEKFKTKEGDRPAVKIRQLFKSRCITCHEDGKKAAAFPLVDFDEHIKPRTIPGAVAVNGAMSLTKLAQTTHVHLLGFSMLYGMTGLILAFSSYPGWLRCILCPLPLVAQVIDISCWWLARYDPVFAHVIMVTGGIVAVGLMSHVVLSLLDMYEATGKVIVLMMLGIGGAGMGYTYFKVVGPYLEKEAANANVAHK